MFDVTCTLKSCKKNEDRFLNIFSYTNEGRRGAVVICVEGENGIIVNGEELMMAISNCMNSGKRSSRNRWEEEKEEE